MGGASMLCADGIASESCTGLAETASAPGDEEETICGDPAKELFGPTTPLDAIAGLTERTATLSCAGSTGRIAESGNTNATVAAITQRAVF